MNVETNQANLGFIQERTLSEIERRIEGSLTIPGFMVDTLSRIHPADVATHFQDDLDISQEIDQEAFRASSPREAWRQMDYPVVACPVPFKQPYDLYFQTKVHPSAYASLGMTGAVSNLVLQRKGLNLRMVISGPIVSEEAVDGEGDTLTTEDAVNGLLTYQEQTIPDYYTLFSQEILTSSDVTVDYSESKATTRRLGDPEIIVCIPVASGEEHETLPKTLRLLAEQSLDREKYEIVLQHNSRQTEEQFRSTIFTDEPVAKDVREVLADEHLWAADLYHQLLQEYPGLRVRVELSLNIPNTSIGYCRARLGQNVANKYLERNSTNNPLLLNMDADVTSLNERFLEELLATAEESDVPVIAARLKWHRKGDLGKDRNSVIGKMLRLERFLAGVAGSFYEVTPYTDSGTAFRLKDYCLAGGHYWIDNFAESIHIVDVLNDMKTINNSGNAIALSGKAIFGSDPRRQLDVMARGYPPSKAWKKGITSFGDPDDPIRTQTSPHDEAEDKARVLHESWIQEMAADFLGVMVVAGVREKQHVIRKGLQIIGLPVPDIFTTPVENEQTKESAEFKPL